MNFPVKIFFGSVFGNIFINNKTFNIMKKIFLLLSVVSLFTLSSCVDDDPDVVYNNTDNYFEAEVFEVNQATFSFDANTGYYTSLYELNPALYPADMILVYRLKDVVNGSDVWEMIPKTLYYDNGDYVEFDFDFTRNDIVFYMGANYDLGTDPNFLQNQVFRVVIIPGYDNSARIDLTDYNNVIREFKVDESNIKTLQPKK